MAGGSGRPGAEGLLQGRNADMPSPWLHRSRHGKSWKSVTIGPVDRGYDGWKRAKIERGLVQARDRSAMIPADEVLRGFGMIVKINVAIGQ